MKRALLAVSITSLLMVSEPARADVSLGANFGATVSFRDGDSGHPRVGIGWPYSHGAGYAVAPGLRFGFTGGSGHHEGYLDSMFAYYSRDAVRGGLATGNYQYNFDGRANTFFVTGGAGFVFAGNEYFSAAALMFGGGVGFRQSIAGGHGTFREELRFDFIPGNRDYQQTFLLGVKLGFDLWFR